MQKLVWQNSKGDKINLTSGHYGITHWEGFSGVDLNIQSQQVPFQDGSVFLDALLSERELTVTIAINDNNNLELRYQLRRELIHNLNPKLGEGYLIYTNDFISKRIKCIANPPIFENHNSNDSGTPKASLTWTACNPYWEDLEDEDVSLTGFEQVNIDYDGDADTEPEIILTGTAVNPIIRNISNFSDVRLRGEIKDSIMNLAPGKKSFNKQNLGFYLNAGNMDNFAESNDTQIVIGATISYTKDLKNFKVALIETTGDRFYCCCYGKGVFLVGGNKLRKSQDGIEWTIVANKPEGDMNAVYYDEVDDVFYMEINKKLYSTSDLSTFTELATLPLQANQIIRHNNAIYIVTAVISGMGNYGCFKYENSTLTTLNTGLTRNVNAIASDGTNLVIGGNGAKLLYSEDDGTTWTPITVTSDINGIYFNQNTEQFIFCGDDGLLGYGTLENITWTNIGEVPRYGCGLSRLFGVVEIVGQDIVFFKNNSFTKSTNIPIDLYCCVYLKNKYIAGGSEGHIYISEDFENWELKDVGVSADITVAEGNENEAYFMDKENNIIYTNDGINFSVKYAPPSQRTSDVNILHKGNYYYGYLRKYIWNGPSITEYWGLYKSLTGSKWEFVSSPHNGSLHNMWLVNDKFILNFSEYNSETHQYVEKYIISEDDGETWTELTSLENREFRNIVYYNGYYVFYEEPDGSTPEFFKSTDLQTLTQIHQDLSCYAGFISVCNNNLFIMALELNQETYEMSTEIYISDLTDLTFIKTYDSAYAAQIQYYNNKYYIALDIVDITQGTETYATDETEDFENYVRHYDSWFIVSNNKLYEMNYYYDSETEDRMVNLKYNNQIIYTGEDDSIEGICYDIMIQDGTEFDSQAWCIRSLPDMAYLTMPLNYYFCSYGVIGHTFDGVDFYFSNGPKIYKIHNNELIAFCTNKNPENPSDSYTPCGMASYNNLIYTITYSDSTYRRSRQILIFDNNGNFIDIKNISYDSPTAYDIQNQVLIASENKLVYFEKCQETWLGNEIDVDRVCVFDLTTNELEFENKDIEIYDGIYRNNIFYGIGYGGIMYAPNGKYWQFINDASFGFRYFVRNKYYYFVGIWMMIGFLEYLLGDNIIEKVESFSFHLSPGENQLVLTYDSGEMIATIKYRRKYIGV